MRVSPIRAGANLRTAAQNTPHAGIKAKYTVFNGSNPYNIQGREPSFGSSNEPSLSFSNSPPFCGSSLNITGLNLEEIMQIIKDTDDARLDGSKLGVYRYSDYMVKAPDSRVTDTALKEFYALLRINQFGAECEASPLPVAVSKIGDRPFLVEEFVNGKINPQGKFTLVQAKSAMQKLLTMDESGIINQNLSPENTVYASADRVSRFVDFNTYSYITSAGRVRHSLSTPSELFGGFMSEIHAKHGTEGILYAPPDLKYRDEVSQMFANSFRQKRKIPEGLHNLLSIANMSENPYLSVPSNLASYESRTVYAKIMGGAVDDPCEFLLDYLQMKGACYHAEMREYLKTLKIPEGKEGMRAAYSVEEAKQRLRKAIEYEDFLSTIFQERPDKYFAKLEAAKMQLNALLYHEDLDRYVSNVSQLNAAYQSLMNVLNEGLYDYREPHYQKYLNAEIEKYTEAFSKTGLSSAPAKQPIVDSLDILTTWFSNIEKDPSSFSIMRQKAKEAVRETLCALCNDKNDFRMTREEIGAKYRVFAEMVSFEALESIKENFADGEFDVERAKLIEEALDEFTNQDLKRLEKAAQEAARTALEESENNGKNAAKAAQGVCSNASIAIKRRAFKGFKHIPAPDDAIREHLKEYKHNKYVYRGGNIMLKGLAILAAAGFLAFEYISYKKRQENVTLTVNPSLKTKQDKMPVISEVTGDKNSPFKQFSI